MALVAGFIAVFFMDLLNVVTYTYIEAAAEQGENLEDATQLTGIMFALGVKDLDLTQVNNKILDVVITQNTYLDYSPRPSQAQILQLAPCNASYWNSLGTNF